MAQIYPEDRGTNYAIREGKKIANYMINKPLWFNLIKDYLKINLIKIFTGFSLYYYTEKENIVSTLTCLVGFRRHSNTNT